MKRTFPQQAIGATNTPQPVFSTTLTANLAASPTPQSIAVASSVGFKVRDKVSLGPGTATFEQADIVAIVDGTHITVIVTKAHTSGDFVGLNFPLANLYVQTKDGNSASLYVGNSPLMTDALWCISQLTKVAAAAQPVDFYDAQIYGANPGNLNEYWVYGTMGDKYTVSLSYC